MENINRSGRRLAVIPTSYSHSNENRVCLFFTYSFILSVSFVFDFCVLIYIFSNRSVVLVIILSEGKM